jgi:hypothetical protein
MPRTAGRDYQITDDRPQDGPHRVRLEAPGSGWLRQGPPGAQACRSCGARRHGWSRGRYRRDRRDRRECCAGSARLLSQVSVRGCNISGQLCDWRDVRDVSREPEPPEVAYRPSWPALTRPACLPVGDGNQADDVVRTHHRRRPLGTVGDPSEPEWRSRPCNNARTSEPVG